MALSATVRFKKSNWLECHRYHYLLLKNQYTNTLLLGDSIIAGILRYLKVWQRYFTPLNALNLGIGGDQVENMIWRAKNLVIPPLLKNVVVLCGTNNLFTDSPMDIADCIVNIGSCLRGKSSSINVFICGLIPRDESRSVNRVLIEDVDSILKYLCLKHDFSFIDQSNGWTLPKGGLDSFLFFKDSFHLIEEENVKLAKLIINSIAPTNNMCFSSNTGKSFSYSDNCKNKVPTQSPYSNNYNSFLLNEHDLPPLSNVCQPISSNVGESRLHQRKPASNVKLVSVHESPIYASSVRELVKPLNVSKPVCSSNATKRNVCNASSVSQRIKPLNVSKPVCSNKTTKRNVCNTSNVSPFTKRLNVSKPLCSSNVTIRIVCSTSSVSKLINPLNVSKTVCSNTTGHNVRKVSSVSQLIKPSTVSKPVPSNNIRNVRDINSISQLVKTFNVTESVCSSNASNSVICNSVCKPVSNFVSDCQPDKPPRKLIDAKRKLSPT